MSRLKGDIGIELEPSETNIYAWKAFLRVRCFTDDSLLKYAVRQYNPLKQHSTHLHCCLQWSCVPALCVAAWCASTPLTFVCFQTFQGPQDTAYEEGVFELAITILEQYPLVPPLVRFRTKIFHPNVHWRVTPPPFSILTFWSAEPKMAVLQILLASPPRRESERCQTPQQESAAKQDLRFPWLRADWGGVSGHPQECMESSLDAAKCLPGHHGAHVGRGLRLASQLRCWQPAEGERHAGLQLGGSHVHPGVRPAASGPRKAAAMMQLYTRQ